MHFRCLALSNCNHIFSCIDSVKLFYKMHLWYVALLSSSHYTSSLVQIANIFMGMAYIRLHQFHSPKYFYFIQKTTCLKLVEIIFSHTRQWMIEQAHEIQP